ncbi:MAG: MATE family efflux transporter [Bacillota bacterium]
MSERSEMLANEKIGKLLFKLSVPATVGMMVQALYNLVDTIFVGRVSMLAIAGIGIVLPIQMIVMAIAQAIGIGGASIISRSLGAKDIERAEKTMGNIFTLVLTMSFSIAFFGSIFLEEILRAFGATENILPYSMDYLSIIFLGTIFFSFAMASNNVVRAEGNAKIAMITMFISAGLNIILDPIFIFAFQMGVRGVAIATVLAQASTATYLAYYFVSGKSSMKVQVKYLKLDLRIVKETFAIGSAAFARQVAGSMMTVILNHNLAIYGGDVAIAAYSVIYRLLMFTAMPIFGVVQGLQPIVGFNYGAKQFERVKEAVRLAVVVTTAIATVGFLMLMVFTGFFIGLFNKDPEMMAIGIKATRMIVFALPLVGFQMVGASLFQSIGKALPAFILSLSRQTLFLIPLVLALPLFWGLIGIWIAFPLADSLAFGITLFMVAKEMKVLNQQVVVTEK